MLEFLFDKTGILRACSFIKGDSKTDVFLWNLKTFPEQLFWRISANSASKHYLKRYSVLSCEFCKLFKNTYFLDNLQTACSQSPVIGSVFKKVANLTAWKRLTVLERDCHTGIFLWILSNFLESFLQIVEFDFRRFHNTKPVIRDFNPYYRDDACVPK